MKKKKPYRNDKAFSYEDGGIRTLAPVARPIRFRV